MKYLLFVFIFFFTLSVIARNLANSTQAEPIEIIEVNSQKRLQDIRDVAMSLNVVDGQTIIDRQLKDTTALSAIVPNFKITQNAAEGTPPAVNIRGVGSVDYNTSTQSPVGVYLDETAMA